MTRTRTFFLFIAISFLAAESTIAALPRVLILGDTDAQTSIGETLQNAGDQVTVVANYADWNGVSPAATNFDVIVLLDGKNYGSTLQSAAAAAIKAHVTHGGGLVMTEWTAYDAYKGTLNPDVAALLPVVSLSGAYDSSGTTWNVIQPGNAVAASLPPSWYDGAGFSIVQAKSNTQVIATNTYDGAPMIVVSTNAGGPVVYFNHDMTYTESVLSAYIQQLIANAVAFVSGNTPTSLSGDVLVLTDDEVFSDVTTGSSKTVLAGLRAAGLRAVSIGSYYDWDGVFPSPSNFKAVVFLDGYYYGQGLKPGVSAALTNYVGHGGGLVVTEWTASDVRDGTLDSTFASLMPVILPAGGGFDNAVTWAVQNPAQPVLSGLPAQWTDAGWISVVQPALGATVLVTGPTNVPMVTLRPFGAGKVVHLNHALTYDNTGLSAQLVRLIANAAAFAGGQPQKTSPTADVLVLGDGGSEQNAIDALCDAGLTVSFGGRYDTWDGSFPNPKNCSAILLLDGFQYGLGFQPTAEVALTNFVATGGGFVVSEWAAYDVLSGNFDSTFGALLPVSEPVTGEGSDATWIGNDTNHPVLAGLPAQWSDGASYSKVVAKNGATILVQASDGTPLVTIGKAGVGTVVHLNHDLTYTLESLGPQIRHLIVNSVTFAGHLQPIVRLSVSLPTGVAGNPVRLQFAPASGYDYTVQFRNGLGSSFQWQNLPGGPFNAGTVDDFERQTQRYYRLQIQKSSP